MIHIPIRIIQTMKHILFLATICILISCCIPPKEKVLSATKEKIAVQTDTIPFDSLIKNFETGYNEMIKIIGDSVSKIKKDGVDFSVFTEPLEKKYNACNHQPEKVLLGYKLAGNYLIHFDSTKKTAYKEKAGLLFYSFLSYGDGKLASEYMKLNLKKVQYIQKEWNNFSEKEKETLLFYGLLRGFNNGLPDFLQNIPK